MMIRTVTILTCLMLVSALPASAQTLDKAERKCASSKLKAIGKKTSAKLKCEAKAIQKEEPSADPECNAKAEEKFNSSFAKAEERGGCVSDGDAASVEADVDAFVAEEVLRQKTGTTGPPSCSTPLMPCGSCGDGVCASYSGGGTACVSQAGATTPGCVSDTQCPAGQFCIAVPGASACAFPCP
ncbi:MAG TPA: hypothetical protein VEC57_19055 [Candidatus Limnocylindrales bacterium]|nr:hypothetical protein [Candidatus Limnocylindrales bacterium]